MATLAQTARLALLQATAVVMAALSPVMLEEVAVLVAAAVTAMAQEVQETHLLLHHHKVIMVETQMHHLQLVQVAAVAALVLTEEARQILAHIHQETVALV
jgi:hypothetical protein